MDGCYSVDTVNSRVGSGEPDSLFSPRSPRVGKRGVILCHGVTAPGQYLDATNGPSSVQLPAMLARNGVTCFSGSFGGDSWANDTAMTRLTAAKAVLVTAGCASDKVCLYGISMGAAVALRWAIGNPTLVAAGYGTAPVSDISDIYTNNRASLRASIGTAWGVTYPTALPAGADLAGQASAVAAIPWRLDYGSLDTLIIPATVTALATAMGANCTATQVDTTNPHGDALFAKTDPATVLAFFVANGA
jgi:pimeloyl-ACP methyl ester carboxylesterase